MLLSKALDTPPCCAASQVAESVDTVITMGCGDKCPVVPSQERITWNLTDPAGQEMDVVAVVCVGLTAGHLLVLGNACGLRWLASGMHWRCVRVLLPLSHVAPFNSLSGPR